MAQMVDNGSDQDILTSNMLSALLAAFLQMVSAYESSKATKATKATALTPRQPHDWLQSSLEVGHPEAIAISIQALSGRTSKI